MRYLVAVVKMFARAACALILIGWVVGEIGEAMAVDINGAIFNWMVVVAVVVVVAFGIWFILEID